VIKVFLNDDLLAKHLALQILKQLKRIADAIEEILRLVKKDMEPKKK